MPDHDRIEEQHSSIEEFLRKKAEIEQAIRERFQREITVMFTDIASSTEFYEIYGDIEGRSMIQRHHDLLKPVVEKHRGQVLRALGDGLMATFEHPPDAARAAVEIQRTLAEENRGKSPSEQIWVKAAIHHGLGIVEADDVYGDMVNTLARICALTWKSDVLVSQAFVDHIKEENDIYYDYVGVKSLKGKAVPVDVYRIIWDPAQMEDLKRSLESEEAGQESLAKTLRLNFSLHGERLRVTVCPNGQQAQVLKQVKEFPYQEGEIRNLVEEIDRCFASADERGRSPKEKLLRMKELGRTLHERVIPDEVASFIAETRPQNLVLQMDACLVYIPWEFLHDGNEFLCLKHNLGRVVSASQQPLARSRYLGRRPRRILLVADPMGDLPASRNEGVSVQRELNRSSRASEISADLRSREVTSEFLSTHLGDYDLLHYAGHFEYVRDDPSRSGLLLSDGKFEVGRLLSLARKAPLPSLVFTNACQSGRMENWSSSERLYGLANAFLVSGVRHYLGGSIDLFDRSSAAFAEEFYRQLVKKQAVGEALRQARIRSIRRYGEENLTWASYVLYGDPSFRYFETDAVPAEESKASRDFPYRRMALPLACVLLVAFAVFVSIRMWNAHTERTRMANAGFNYVHAGQLARAEQTFDAIQRDDPLYYQGMSVISLNRGDVEKAEENLSLAQKNQPDAPYLGIIKAHLLLNQGKLDEASTAYRKRLEGQGLERWQQAECYFGLGRVFMARGDLVQAVAAFDEAIRLDPAFLQAYTAKGLSLDRLGRPREAVELYQQAAAVNPEDPIVLSLHSRSRELLSYREPSERRARVDQLISDLVQRYQEGPSPGEIQDEWSSRPFYLFFLSLETKGQPSPKEGEDAYVDELVSHNLKNSTRFHLVERGLLGRLLEELKLSTSQLADPQTALRLGKILSARILATGALVRYKGQLKISLRGIDTESSQVAVMASVTCQFGEDPAKVLETLVGEFLSRLASTYPIRGRVTEVQPGEVSLNVGRAMGVTPGMRFRLVENGRQGAELIVSEVNDMTAKATPENEPLQARTGWRVEGI